MEQSTSPNLSLEDPEDVPLLTKRELMPNGNPKLVTINIIFTKILDQIKANSGAIPETTINVFKQNLFTFERRAVGVLEGSTLEDSSKDEMDELEMVII